MLQLLRGAGLVLALEEALVDEIRNVLHFVFAHPSRCAVRGRQFRRRSLRNNTGVLGNVVHVLGNAARRCRLSPGLALLDAKSWAGTAALRSSYSAHVALVSSTEPKHIAHVRFGYPRLVNGHQLWTLLLSVRRWNPAARRGFWTWDTKSVRKWFLPIAFTTRMLSSGYSSRFLDEAPVSTPVELVQAAPGLAGLGSPDAAAGVPLTGGAKVAGAGATGAAWDTGVGVDGFGGPSGSQQVGSGQVGFWDRGVWPRLRGG
jgi:hypothetical protein